MSAVSTEPKPLFVTVGRNDARAFGMDAATRAAALAAGDAFAHQGFT